jgi:hypothetical protein
MRSSNAAGEGVAEERMSAGPFVITSFFILLLSTHGVTRALQAAGQTMPAPVISDNRNFDEIRQMTPE